MLSSGYEDERDGIGVGRGAALGCGVRQEARGGGGVELAEHSDDAGLELADVSEAEGGDPELELADVTQGDRAHGEGARGQGERLELADLTEGRPGLELADVAQGEPAGGQGERVELADVAVV